MNLHDSGDLPENSLKVVSSADSDVIIQRRSADFSVAT